MHLFWRLAARFAARYGHDLSGIRRGDDHLAAFFHASCRFSMRRNFAAFSRTSRRSMRSCGATATQIIAAEDVVLTGMAAIAAAPDGYWLDYAARCWRQHERHNAARPPSASGGVRGLRSPSAWHRARKLRGLLEVLPRKLARAAPARSSRVLFRWSAPADPGANKRNIKSTGVPSSAS